MLDMNSRLALIRVYPCPSVVKNLLRKERCHGIALQSISNTDTGRIWASLGRVGFSELEPSSCKWGARPPRAQPTTPSSSALAGGAVGPFRACVARRIRREGAPNDSRGGCAPPASPTSGSAEALHLCVFLSRLGAFALNLTRMVPVKLGSCPGLSKNPPMRGRNFTLPPFFSLSSPKGGEGWGEEVNCF